MDYIFVLKDKDTVNQGWWLKISSSEELSNYLIMIDLPRFHKALTDVKESREFGGTDPRTGYVPKPSPYCKHADALAYSIGAWAFRNQISFDDAMEELSHDKHFAMAKALREGNTIYLNQKGGWHVGKDERDAEWVRRKELIFPVFKHNQISVEKFPGGTHFYAYVDGLQVRNGDQMKWDTYDEALSFAKKWINKTDHFEEKDEETDKDR